MSEEVLPKATAFEEVVRRLLAETTKRKRKNALAAGFASLEEYEQHKLEKRRKQEIQEEESIKAYCLAAGMSREQYDQEQEDFLQEQIERHPKPKEHHFPPPMLDCDCDCEYHAFPSFCPKNLIEYKSQDFPHAIDYLGARHYIDSEKVEIKETDKSRRLEQELLEQHWMRMPLEVPMRDIPPWFKADGVVQQIIRQSALRDTSISPSPSPERTPSLLYDHPTSVSPTSVSPSANKAATASMDTSVEVEEEDHTLNKSCPQDELHSNVSAGNSKELVPKACAGSLQQKRPRATKGTEYRRVARGSRITKISRKPAMGLRSRNSLKFYELGPNGKTTTLRR
ncbi:MAG: hypothetical protein Q9216_005711 [Gyalolechia sp. 2 TL-2023]